jgi:protein TonB
MSPLQMNPPASGAASVQLVVSWEAAPPPAEDAAPPVVQLLIEPEPFQVASSPPSCNEVERECLQTRVFTVSPLGDRPLLPPTEMEAGGEPTEAPIVAPVAEVVRAARPRPDPDPKTQTRPLPRAERTRPQITDVAAQPADERAIKSSGSRASPGAQSPVAVRRLAGPEPEYPPAALAAGLTGRVVLRVTIGPRGHVTRASVHRSSGVTSLDESALRAVRQWRFEPPQRDGVPVQTEVAIPIRFRIEDQPSGS